MRACGMWYVKWERENAFSFVQSVPASENEIESGENPVSPVSHRDTTYPSAKYICISACSCVCVCLDMPGSGRRTDLCCLIMANINLMPDRTAASSVPHESPTHLSPHPHFSCQRSRIPRSSPPFQQACFDCVHATHSSKRIKTRLFRYAHN